MSDWIPTTQQVRDGYRYDPEDEYRNPLHAGANAERAGRDFDRWLEQVKAETRDDALADAGLLARPLPSREEIADVIEAEILDFFDWPGLHPDLPYAVADAVLALLKGQNA